MPPLDRDLYETLVRLHHPATYHTARRVVRSDADAMDVVQQVFVRVLQRKVDLPVDPASAGPRLRWLAGRLALNHLRSARRRRSHEEARAMENRQSTDPIPHQDDLRAVRDALEELPNELRAPLALRFHDGMTLAAVADVLGCAESTAHERIRRALDALRVRLREIGFAAAGGRLDALLPTSTMVPPIPVALESTLLALRAPALLATVGAKAAVLASIAIVGLGAVVALRALAGPPAAPVAVEPAARTGNAAISAAARDLSVDAVDSVDAVGATDVVRTPLRESSGASVPIESDDAQDPLLRPARLTGRVLDPAAGTPLGGARVRALSEESRGKGARFDVEVATDAAGFFEISLPVVRSGGQAYRVVISCADHVPFRSARLVARSGDTLAPIVAQLRRWAEDVEGVWSMDLTVTDEHGQPIPRAVVTMLRRKPARGPAEREPVEASARVSAAGLATLRGDHHGEKLLRVAAFGTEFAPVEIPLRIDTEGPHLRRVALGIGRTIEGRVVAAAAGGQPVAGVWIEAQLEGDSVSHAQTDDDGRFTIRGLAERPHTLTAFTAEWSSFAIDAVPAGARDVLIRTKLRDDPRAHGDHLGEIHGRIVDATTGAPVEVPFTNVRTYWLAPEIVDWRREVVAAELRPSPVQVVQQSVQVDGEGGVRRVPHAASEFHETDLRTGRYLLFVWSRDHAVGYAGPFELGPGRLVSDVEVRLERGVTVDGEVRDAAGRPLAGARVWLGPVTDAGDEARAAVARALAETGDADARVHFEWRERTDAEGRFSVSRIPTAVDLRVHVAHPVAGHAAGAPLVLQPAESARDVGTLVVR